MRGLRSAALLNTDTSVVLTSRFNPIQFIILLSAVVAGCSNSDFGSVSGRVTLDGDPLENAFVEFSPTSGQGSSSSGRTDDQGEYHLSFSRSQEGALIGEHKVKITTRDIVADDQGNDRWLPERVPKKYNAETTLSCDVEQGSNRHDFELTSK